METAQEQDQGTIAARAYAIYLEREREGVAGDALSDWYAAEQEILTQETAAPKGRKRRNGH